MARTDFQGDQYIFEKLCFSSHTNLLVIVFYVKYGDERAEKGLRISASTIKPICRECPKKRIKYWLNARHYV